MSDSNPGINYADRFRRVAVVRSDAAELDAFRDELEKRLGRKVPLSEAIKILLRKYAADAESIANDVMAREMASI